MILINLLPEEYRQKSKTPVRLLAAVIGVVIVNSCLAVWWGWKYVGESAEAESELAVLQDVMKRLGPQIEYHEALGRESQQYTSRVETLRQITVNRISWTEKLDQLVDVVNQGGEEDEYLIWFDDLQLTQSNDARKKNYGGIKGGGHSGSNSIANVAHFLHDIEGASFGRDFNTPAPPENTGVDENEDLIPRYVTNFPFQLDLQAPDARSKAKAGLAPAPPAEGAKPAPAPAPAPAQSEAKTEAGR